MSEREHADHETSIGLFFCIGLAIAFVLAFGYFSGLFAWMHDIALYTQEEKMKIDADIKAETSCSNLADFIKPWQGYWQPPYSVEKAKERMIELKC